VCVCDQSNWYFPHLPTRSTWKNCELSTTRGRLSTSTIATMVIYSLKLRREVVIENSRRNQPHLGGHVPRVDEVNGGMFGT
jgi:hypothetical protein